MNQGTECMYREDAERLLKNLFANLRFINNLSIHMLDKNLHVILYLFMLFNLSSMNAQLLQPGFDKQEYIETLKVNQKTHIAVNKWAANTSVPDPTLFHYEYRSPRVAFDNIWDLWIHNNKRIAMIAVQGSIATEASFLANLYAAMIPASGELKLNNEKTFKYQLSDNPRAAVHAGWLLAMAHLSETIEHKIDSCYKAGIKDFILTGHSQGGGITFLLDAHLNQLQREGKIEQDVVFKTYCSAGPKPGNLVFAYDFENSNREGFAYNVVSAVDWVPEVPFSVQTIDDFNNVNPFRGAKAMIKRQKFAARIALKHVYNRLDKPSRKAQKNYQKYLGKMVSTAVKKQLPDLTLPQYYNSNHYVRTGSTIVLYPDEAYFKLHSNDPSNTNIWEHHWPVAYLIMAEKL